jgi:hypothetical protein
MTAWRRSRWNEIQVDQFNGFSDGSAQTECGLGWWLAQTVQTNVATVSPAIRV